MAPKSAYAYDYSPNKVSLNRYVQNKVDQHNDNIKSKAEEY